MKKNILYPAFMLLLLAGSFSVSGERVKLEQLTERSINIDKSKILTLAENGKADFVIVCPDKNKNKVCAFAATELKTFLDKALGADIRIEKTESADRPAIIIGDTELTRQAGIDVKTLPRDGYYIKTVGNKIFIAGIDDNDRAPEALFKTGGMWIQYYQRGTVFGVYDFLERFLGIRFYFPGEIGTVVPKLSELKLPAINIFDRPDYTIRYFDQFGGKWINDSPKNGFAERNLNNARYRMQTRHVPCCHGLLMLGYDERFGKTNPEYFALMDNGKRYLDKSLLHSPQLCYSSNIKEEIYKDAEGFAKGETAASRKIVNNWGVCWDPANFQPGFFCVMPNDSFYKCRCEKCRKIFSQGDEAASEFIWNMTCDIAEKLKKNNIDLNITQMGYDFYGIPPKRSIPENVQVMLATRGPWNENRPQERKNDDDRILKWTEKLGHKVWLWNYANKFGKMEMPGIPNLTPKAVGSFYSRMAPYIFGAYMESETDYYIFNYLNYYVMSRTAWNNKTDTEALLDEHYKLMFGPGAAQIKEVFEAIESKWINDITGRPIVTALGPTSVPASSYEIWEKIYSVSELKRLNALFDKAEMLAGADTDSLNRIKFMHRHMLEPLMEESKKYFVSKDEIADLKLYVKPFTANEKIVIDGNLEKPVWQQASSILLLPLRSDKCELRTDVKVLKDNDYLYLGFECAEPDSNNIAASIRKADDPNMWTDSSVEVFLNPSGDRKNYYHIIVNASGGVYDTAAVRTGGGSQFNQKWDSHAEVKTVTGKNRWTAEIAIPLKYLGNVNPDSFPANFCRNRILTGKSGHIENYTWNRLLKTGFHEVENFGVIVFGEAPADNSLIRNGDFSRQDLAEWGVPKAPDGASITLDKSTYISDGQSLKISNEKSENRLGPVVQYNLPLKSGIKYHISYYIKTEKVTPLVRTGYSGAVVNIWDGGNHWFPINFYQGTMPWTKQGFFFTSNADAAKSKSFIYLWLKDAEGTVWFDNITLREVEEKK